MKRENKTVLVTGASGLIGRKLVNELLSKGYSVVGLTNRNDLGLENERLEIVKGDIEKLSKLIKPTFKIDYICHLAAYQNIDDDKYDRFNRINVRGTLEVLKLAQKLKVKRLIYVSTVMVFEPTGKVARNEKWKKLKDSNNFYVKSKIEALNLVDGYKDKLPIVVVYPTIVLGLKRFGKESSSLSGWKKVLIKVIGKNIPGGVMCLIGDAKRIINFVRNERLARILIQLFDAGKDGEDYIVGGKNMTADEYLKANGVKLRWRLPLGLLKIVAMLPLPKSIRFIALNPPVDICFDSSKVNKLVNANQ